MTTSLIVGAGRFSAVHLERRLRAEGPDVRVFGAGRSPAPHSATLDGYSQLDVLDAEALRTLVRATRPDRVFHLAAVSTGDDALLHAVNVGGTANALEAVRTEAPRSRVLVVGSAAEYGVVAEDRLPIDEETPCHPVTAYGRSKLEATRLAVAAARLGLHVVVARPFNLVGSGIPSGLVVGDLIARLRDIAPAAPAVLRVGRLDSQRDFVAIGDAVDCYVRLVDSGRPGQIYNVCSGEPTAIQAIVRSLILRSGRDVSIVQDPLLMQNHDVPISYGSYRRARTAVGFVPGIPLEAALADAWRHAAGAGP